MASPLYLVTLLWLGAACIFGEMALLTRDATSMLPSLARPAELAPATHTVELAPDTTVQAAPSASEMRRTCAAYTAASHFDVARGCYEALLSLDTHDFDAQYAYAQLLLDHFPGSHAVAVLEAAVAIAAPPFHQAHMDAFNSLGLIYRDQLDFEKAASVFAIPLTPLNRSHPSFLPLLINLAAVHLQQGDHDTALTLTNDALIIAPENAFVYHNLGAVYSHLRDYRSALHYSQVGGPSSK
ncbi:hypothetical protein SDRG_03940 [Saprolegnia diclina VS20]|uniref:Uncharacterized protein n=1 Tax=Saprolegnia diclina (strain VS20) TaxID=1156394 RepID=T0S8N5_SAPDV|nr:hypothetical protein SDRG_03940 [Saprolegnia diclina VS20]EQC38987.1 hypothetical protein SDRG_03940 [Saprolegnia diclina VS20]|eukprot:XP_008607811.1 hypothetical protein SDRG_03940 [Saprolegnia diclina VS20]